MKSLVFAFLAFSIAFLPVNASAELRGIARIMLVEGDVQVRMSDGDDWVPAAVNTPLEEGDSLWSPEGSRVEIQLQDGTYIRLSERSALDILDISDNVLQFHMALGHAYIRTGAMRTWSYQFDLTESSVTVSDRARLRLDIAADGDEDISVIKGMAYVEGYGTKTRVRSGEMISLEESRSELLPLNPPDAWERWNQKRDRTLAARGRSSGHLPEELVAYEDELSRSGEWVEVQEYGRVWRPTVSISVDWAPYRVGRWIWRGGDYVWISYESWGWAPYHFGRWVVTGRWGWCWVPPTRGEVYWSPAYVGWVTTPRYVAWVPLAPGDTYYGRGYYGRRSVNVTNVTNVNITNVTYRNQNVHRNAVTVVERESFGRGRVNIVRAREEVLRHDRASISRPEPPAARTARMPVVKEISPAKLPPPRVASTPARELKHRLPRIQAPAAGPSTGAPPHRTEGRREATPRQGMPPGQEKKEQAPRPPEARPPQSEAAPTGGVPAQRRERRMRDESALPAPATQAPATIPAEPAPRPQVAPAPPAAAPRHDQPKAEGVERRSPRSVWKVRPNVEAQPGGQPSGVRPERAVPQRERREQHRQ